MKPIKLLMIVTAAALVIFGVGGYAMAFHDGGVAHCDGCHTMHNSENGQTIIPGGAVGTAGAHLTLGATPTDTCLNCHEGSGSFRVFYDGPDPTSINLTPGGDFYWMTKTFTYVTHGTHTSAADNHGHNVIAPTRGLVEDTTNKSGVAPGGTYPVNDLHCSSCHDPHGKKVNKSGPIAQSGSYGPDPALGEWGNYRLLGDVGYAPGPGTVVFTNSPPVAQTYHYRNDGGQAELDDRHTDYGRNMSEWCSNCHVDFLSNGGTPGTHAHPAANSATLAGTPDLANNYNIYKATGDTTGTQATAYTALVPFERQISDPTIGAGLDKFTTAGPDSSSNAMCLTCHRAHASAFPNAGRWDFETEFPAVDSHPKDTDTGATPGDELASYYNRDMVALFGPNQRSFCNKCHLKD